MAKKEKVAPMEQKEMTLEEAKALRAAKHAALPKKATEEEKREAFRVFWAQEKASYALSCSVTKQEGCITTSGWN